MKTHWKKLNNPDYLGAWDFQPKQEIVLTIKTVTRESVVGAEGKKEDCTVAYFTEKVVDGIPVKPMILNATNSKMIEKLYGSPYIEDWPGKRIQLRVERVKAFGDVVDALRIRKIVPREITKDAEIICEVCGNAITESDTAPGWTPLRIAQGTMKKFGKAMCMDCGAIAREPEMEADVPEPAADPLAEKENSDDIK